ncbi:MAG: glycosyltransferase family 4 protein [Thermoflexales bacterium]|nr:glycosyltransferase family 4 protein [Thermoflexales bacterium]
MNILLLTDKYPPDIGGLAVSTWRLARGLAKAGHAVCVSAPTDTAAPGNLVEIVDDRVRVFRLGLHPRYDDTLSDWFDRIVALYASYRFDLVHALYVTQPAFVAVAVARYLGLPSVVSARGNDLDRTIFDPARFSQISWALHHANAITAVTTDLARKARAFAPGRDVRFIPNAVDTFLFRPGSRSKSLIKSLELGDAPVVAFLGEARQKKGLTVLLPAFARLCASSEQKPILLLVGGVRKEDEPILQVFRRQDPTLNVRVVPNVPLTDVPAYYHLADVVVIPSLRDGMPNALLEAMACEKAVIASMVGGIPDVLGKGSVEDGVLVPPGNVTALADAMAGLLSDPRRRTRLGRAARDTVEAEFTPAKEIERNMGIYKDVVRGA